MYLVEMMDSSTFKRFTASMDNILESLEDVDLNETGQQEVYQLFPSLLNMCWIVELRNVFFLVKQKTTTMKSLQNIYLESNS